MKERPILFSGAMVKAIIAGKKTQTRRLVAKLGSGLALRCYVGRNGERWSFTAGDRAGVAYGLLCPYGAPGDRLWVRETHAIEDLGDDGMRVVWRADRAAAWASTPAERFFLDSNYAPDRWRPSIHMPRWASRLLLEVTSIRVQRLQEISEEDAEAEGVTPITGAARGGLSHRAAFMDLWDTINGARAPWASDPFVFVVCFKLAEMRREAESC